MNHIDMRYDLGMARVRELTEAGSRARKRAAERAAVSDVEIRVARSSDAQALEELATLDGRPAPQAPVLVASVRGSVRAAIGSDGRAVSDPFVRSADLLDLLRVRARHLARR